MRRLSLLLFLPGLLVSSFTVAAQGLSTTLQNGSSVEKKLSQGQKHSYALKLDKDEYAQITLEQHDIDVVVTVFQPEGQLLKRFDSPNGNDGPEFVEFVADTSGTYLIEVSPLEENGGSGSYEMKVADVRRATEQELLAHRNEGVRKAKGLALLIETSEQLNQVRLAETRIDMQIRSALMLWDSDQKRALALMTQAMDTVKQMAADLPQGDDAVAEDYQLVMKLRRQIIHTLAPRDPEAALKFMRSTRIPSEPVTRYGQTDPELQLETQLINRIVDADPKRAFELAEDLLKRDLSYSVLTPITRLAMKDHALAARLAHDIARKIIAQDLVKNQTAGYLTNSLLQTVKTAPSDTDFDGNGDVRRGLLSKEDLADLFQKIVDEVLSYSPGPNPAYGPEFGTVRMLAMMLRQMPEETRAYAGGRADAVEKKLIELLGNSEQPIGDWQRYQNAINNGSVDSALESVADAPESFRDSLYQQVANKVASSGDVSRARDIVTERMTNQVQRQMALDNLKQQAITQAAAKGRFEEALRLLSRFRRDERHELLNQILDEMGPGVKRAQALQYLEQARNLISSSSRAENQQQMLTLLAIARKLGRYDVNRAFETTAPLLDQFNELTGAAVTMNGFDQDYYQDGELVLSADNPVASLASDFADTFATLAMFDFDRAKRATEGMNRPEVRLQTLLLIAQRTMELQIDADAPEAEGPYGD